jgi:hypothetical protein
LHAFWFQIGRNYRRLWTLVEVRYHGGHHPATGENPLYGILGRTVETSASFEARYAPLSYPTVEAPVRIYPGGDP